MVLSTTCDSPMGIITLASDGMALTGLWLSEHKRFGNPVGRAKEFETVDRPDLPIFDKAKAWLDRYFAGKRPSPSSLPLSPEGSDFRRKVLKLLTLIPYGRVTTYGALAKDMAESMKVPVMSARAIGGAVGRNPISIIIPCHRVVGAGGNLTGYGGGIHNKMRLLAQRG